MKRSIIFPLLLLSAIVYGQSSNDVLNLLIANKTISQEQADSVRAEAAIKQQDTEAAKKSFPVTASRLLQLSGYTQLRYQNLEEAGKKSGFDLRRARVDAKGSISPYFSYVIMVDFADKPKLLDAYGEIRLSDYFTITAGQFKLPLSMENLASDSKLDFIDRAQVVETLVSRSKDVIGNQNGRDIGVQAGGRLVSSGGLPVVEYRLGVFNGSGIDIADTANSAKDVVGRLIFSPVKGLSFGGGAYLGYCKAIKPDVAGKSQTRNRYALEASYVRQRFSLKGEYISGVDGKTNKDGGYLQAGYFIVDKKLQLAARYDTYDPNTKTDRNALTNYAFGANYIFNNWSKLQINYTIHDEQGTEISNNYLTVQYQICF